MVPFLRRGSSSVLLFISLARGCWRPSCILVFCPSDRASWLASFAWCAVEMLVGTAAAAATCACLWLLCWNLSRMSADVCESHLRPAFGVGLPLLGRSCGGSLLGATCNGPTISGVPRCCSSENCGTRLPRPTPHSGPLTGWTVCSNQWPSPCLQGRSYFREHILVLAF